MDVSDLPSHIAAKISVLPNGCWEWTGALSSEGYSSMGHEGRTQSAHRVVYKLLVGPIPTGLVIDHECHGAASLRGECLGGPTCPHRRCVCPQHMVPKTHRENILAPGARSPSAVAAALTHCPSGHPYSGENLILDAFGHRRCRACHRAVGRRHWPERAEKVNQRRRERYQARKASS